MLVTVLEGIQRSSEFLARKGVDSPRLQAELLLAGVLGLPRMQLYLRFDQQISPAQLDQYRDWVKRRGQREPLQHILGSTSFCGLEIKVTRDVLVPRPETELLAEQGWLFLNRLATGDIPPTALDIGTGSGCIAIALAVKCPAAQVYATDLSAAALCLAADNAARHAVADRIHLLEGEGFAAVQKPAQFNLLISNPPYIPTPEIDTLQPEVRDYEPGMALDGGPDGLNFYHRFATEAGDFLKRDGRLMLEFGDGQADTVRELFEKQNWIVEQILPDYTQRPRIIVARK